MNKITLNLNALSADKVEALRALLKQQFEKNNDLLTAYPFTADEESETARLYRVQQDLVGTLYVIERYQARV